MAYNFKKLSEVELIEDFPEGASAIIEANGAIKRCPSVKGSGGAGKVFHGVATIDAENETFTIEVEEETTLEELKELIQSGDPAKLVLSCSYNPEGMAVNITTIFSMDTAFDETVDEISLDVVAGSNLNVAQLAGQTVFFGTYPGVFDEPNWFIMNGK